MISHSKCRDMSSLPFPQGFVYRHLSPARDGQTLPLLYLTKWKESVCHPARAESWDPEFPFAPPSSALSPPSCHISAVNLLLHTCLSFIIFFWNILLLSEREAQGCALIRSLCLCYLVVNVKGQMQCKRFQTSATTVENTKADEKTALAVFSPIFCTIP